MGVGALFKLGGQVAKKVKDVPEEALKTAKVPSPEKVEEVRNLPAGAKRIGDVPKKSDDEVGGILGAILDDFADVTPSAKKASALPSGAKRVREVPDSYPSLPEYSSLDKEALSRGKSLGFKTGKDDQWFHATDAEFDEFKIDAPKKNRVTNYDGIYLSQSKQRAGEHGSKIGSYFVKADKIAKDGEIVPDEAMLAKYKELLLKETTYKEGWIDNAIIPEFLEKGRMKQDLSGSLKREVMLAGGYDAVMDGGDMIILNAKNIRRSAAAFALGAAASANLMAEETAPSPEIFYGNDAVAKVIELEGELTPLQRAVVLEEGYVDAVYEDDAATSGIRSENVKTRGVGQTGKYMDMTFKESFEAKLNEAKELFPNFDNLSHAQQEAIISTHYRGDTRLRSGKVAAWVGLVNEGKFEEASVELLDHKEYKERKKKGRDGVVKRLEKASKGLKGK